MNQVEHGCEDVFDITASDEWRRPLTGEDAGLKQHRRVHARHGQLA
jgi:hypothetical protein